MFFDTRTGVLPGPPSAMEFKTMHQDNGFLEGCCEATETSYEGNITANVLTVADVTYTVGGTTPSKYQVKWQIRATSGLENIIQGNGPDVLSAVDAAKLTAMGFTVAGTETYASLTDLTVPAGTVPTIKVWVSPDCCNFIKVYSGPIDNS